METETKLIDLDAPDPLKTINRSAAARALGLNVSNISRILTTDPAQKRIPHIITCYRLSRYLSLTLDDLYRLLHLPE